MTEGRIREIVDNYARISFNFGPTLLSWLQRHQKETYQAILEADRRSLENFSGHGSALAQAYNHMIMPLANERDQRTQVLWGIRDFRHRFQRKPEGMWLPETAVDLPTLEVLAEQGIQFTILAPHQARRVRRIEKIDKGEKARWQDVTDARIDPRMPYLCRLPSGRSIALFFYDGAIARDVAFGGLLNNGVDFAHRMLGVFSVSEEEPMPQLAHIATDGETYGHHHRFGDMALAYCLAHIESTPQAEITVYGAYLEQFPPIYEVEIAEETSWSCAHGIERWRSDCGCKISDKAGWNQAWRAPLREALDWLRDRLAPLYEKEMAPLLPDPWAARDDYIEVILDRSPDHVLAFLNHRAGRELAGDEQVKALRLLEMQRQAMLMYTSCGWFFDELSGIETTQILGYASRAMQLAQEVGGAELEGEFLGLLQKAPSNLEKYRNGARVYEQLVKPTRLDLIRVAAHHAIAAQFDHSELKRVYCYLAHQHAAERFHSGNLTLAVGRTHIRSEITWNEGEFAFAVLHFGGHNLNAGIREFGDEAAFTAMVQDLKACFERGDIPEVFRNMDQHFSSHSYSLWHLFKDEQRRVLGQVLKAPLEDIEASFGRIYQNQANTLRFLHEVGMPIPELLATPVDLYLNTRLKRLLERKDLDPERIREAVDEVKALGVRLDKTILEFVAGRQITSCLVRLAQNPDDLKLLQAIDSLMGILAPLPLKPDLWKAQNCYFAIWKDCREKVAAEESADPAVQKWREHFHSLGRFLRVSPG